MTELGRLDILIPNSLQKQRFCVVNDDAERNAADLKCYFRFAAFVFMGQREDALGFMSPTYYLKESRPIPVTKSYSLFAISYASAIWSAMPTNTRLTMNQAMNRGSR